MEDAKLKSILLEARTIAVVGCSRDPDKPGYYVPEYLKSRGYRIIPVNPNADTILGEKSYGRLGDIADGVDVVLVFRPADEAPQIVGSAIALRPKLIWLQEGIRSPESCRMAKEESIPYVEDRCLMVEHRRLLGYGP